MKINQRIAPRATHFTGTFNIRKLNPINNMLQKDIIMVSATKLGDEQIAKLLMEKKLAFEYSPEIMHGPENSLDILSAEEIVKTPKKKH